MADLIPINIVIGDRTYRIKTNAQDEEAIRGTLKIINEKIIEFKTAFSGKDMQDYIAMVLIWYATQAAEVGNPIISKDILIKKGPHFNVVDPETKVLDALIIMKTENLSYVVVKLDDQFLGIMSEHDYAQKVKLQGKQSNLLLVKDIMTHDLPVVSYDEDLKRCMVLMNVYKTRYLPVYDQIEFRGILTMNDLMREVMYDENPKK